MSVAETKARIAINNILFATDFSEASKSALPFAATLARRYKASVFVANVIEEVPVTSVPMDYMPPEYERERGIVERHMQEFLKSDPFAGLKTEVLIEPGFVWPVLARMVQERQIDLIVLGTHGHGAIWRAFFGSAAEEICRHVACPVLTVGPDVKVPAGGPDRIEKILFATDFSDGSLHALRYALALAEDHDARLVLLHVIQPPSIPLNLTDQMVAESDKRLRNLIDPGEMPTKRPIFTTLVGIPADQIVAMANRESADLIVMGMHRATALATHWPFEVASHIVARAQCPVLSLRW